MFLAHLNRLLTRSTFLLNVRELIGFGFVANTSSMDMPGKPLCHVRRQFPQGLDVGDHGVLGYGRHRYVTDNPNKEF